MSKSKKLVDFDKAHAAYNAALLRFYTACRDNEKAVKNRQDAAEEVSVANERSCNAYVVLSPSDKKEVRFG